MGAETREPCSTAIARIEAVPNQRRGIGLSAFVSRVTPRIQAIVGAIRVIGTMPTVPRRTKGPAVGNCRKHADHPLRRYSVAHQLAEIRNFEAECVGAHITLGFEPID